MADQTGGAPHGNACCAWLCDRRAYATQRQRFNARGAAWAQRYGVKAFATTARMAGWFVLLRRAPACAARRWRGVMAVDSLTSLSLSFPFFSLSFFLSFSYSYSYTLCLPLFICLTFLTYYLTKNCIKHAAAIACALRLSCCLRFALWRDWERTGWAW